MSELAADDLMMPFPGITPAQEQRAMQFIMAAASTVSPDGALYWLKDLEEPFYATQIAAKMFDADGCVLPFDYKHSVAADDHQIVLTAKSRAIFERQAVAEYLLKHPFWKISVQETNDVTREVTVATAVEDGRSWVRSFVHIAGDRTSDIYLMKLSELNQRMAVLMATPTEDREDIE